MLGMIGAAMAGAAGAGLEGIKEQAAADLMEKKEARLAERQYELQERANKAAHERALISERTSLEREDRRDERARAERAQFERLRDRQLNSADAQSDKRLEKEYEIARNRGLEATLNSYVRELEIEQKRDAPDQNEIGRLRREIGATRLLLNPPPPKPKTEMQSPRSAEPSPEAGVSLVPGVTLTERDVDDVKDPQERANLRSLLPQKESSASPATRPTASPATRPPQARPAAAPAVITPPISEGGEERKRAAIEKHASDKADRAKIENDLAHQAIGEAVFVLESGDSRAAARLQTSAEFKYLDKDTKLEIWKLANGQSRKK